MEISGLQTVRQKVPEGGHWGSGSWESREATFMPGKEDTGRESLKTWALLLLPCSFSCSPRWPGVVAGPGRGLCGGGQVAKSGEEVLREPRVFLLGEGL